MGVVDAARGVEAGTAVVGVGATDEGDWDGRLDGTATASEVALPSVGLGDEVAPA